jgi:hypothetical protein
MTGVDHVRIKNVDFPIEPAAPDVAVATNLLVVERLEGLRPVSLAGEARGGEVQISRSVAGPTKHSANRKQITADWLLASHQTLDGVAGPG